MGQSLAMTSLLATLALLLSRFSFRLADQASISVAPEISGADAVPLSYESQWYQTSNLMPFPRTGIPATLAELTFLQSGSVGTLSCDSA